MQLVLQGLCFFSMYVPHGSNSTFHCMWLRSVDKKISESPCPTQGSLLTRNQATKGLRGTNVHLGNNEGNFIGNNEANQDR